MDSWGGAYHDIHLDKVRGAETQSVDRPAKAAVSWCRSVNCNILQHRGGMCVAIGGLGWAKRTCPPPSIVGSVRPRAAGSGPVRGNGLW